MSNPSRVLITIINPDPTRSYDIRLAGSAKNADESLVMETKNEVLVPSIHIDAGKSRQLNLNDFRIFDANVVRFKGTNTQNIARTHILPDGIYTLCVQALDYKTLSHLSPDAPSGCKTFEIKNADAPMLLSPSNTVSLETEKSPIIQFQWIAPTQAPPGAVYELTLVEIPQGMDPEASFRNPTGKRVFAREVRGANTLTVRSAELQLESGKMYAWRVHVTDPQNTMMFRNDGYSPAWSFNYGVIGIKPKLKMPDTLVCGGFEIVVKKWDDPYQSLDPKLPSGTGCIKFDCKKKAIPPKWGGVILQQRSFDVIGTSVADSSSQMHVTEAQIFKSDAQIGDKILLDLPASSTSKSSIIADKSSLIDIIKKLPPLDCIMVTFHDVQWTPPNKPKVVLTAGTAVYPGTPPYPTPPAMLVLDTSFTLAIDSLVLTTTDATVQGKLLLPKNIVSADTCTRAFLKLPKTTITSNCEFYKEVTTQDSGYGKWWIGNSELLVHGGGYVIDFSSTQSPAGLTPPLAASWKGVVLRKGESDAMPTGTMISNRGYTKAGYGYENATITDPGFEGSLKFLGTNWRFTTLEPFGYDVWVQKGGLELSASEISGGKFQDGSIDIPRAAIRNGSGGQISVSYGELNVQSDMDLFGPVKMQALYSYTWGEFSRTTGNPMYYTLAQNTALSPDTGNFYLSARQIKPYYPADSFWHSPNLTSPATQLEAQGIQGVTLAQVATRDLIIYTPDVPIPPTKRLIFPKETIAKAWMNIIRTGVHSEIDIVCDSLKLANKLLGDSARTKYQGRKSFKTDFGVCFDKRSTDVSGVPSSVGNNPKQIMPFQFVESAVWNSELEGQVHLPKPAEINVRFKNMMFTSTADCAGGQVDLSKPDTLPYWGVALVAKDTNKSAGIVCARLGVIYLTAAGVAEPRHYSKPFWLTWGELKADGNLGKLYFDYNSVGQRMDGFPFSPSLVRLSDYTDGLSKDSAMLKGMKIGSLFGFLHAYGSVSVHFFGGKMLSLSDYKVDNTAAPYTGRWMRVQQGSVYTAPPSDIHWQRNWAGGIANFDYTTVLYDSAAQDGFYGTGTCTLLEITGGIASTITIRAERMCFSMGAEASHDINMAVVANFSAMEKIWGCGCIVGENLQEVVVGGEISTGFGVGASLAARGGGMLSIKISFLPTQTKLSLQGDMYVLLASSVNAEVSGIAELTEDHGVGFIEGYLKGTVQLSTFLAGVSAEGELQWHFGTDFQMVQGRVAVGIYGPVQFGLESGVFLGVNCPKSKIWVTDGINGRFSFNKGGLPANVTGTYFFLSISESVNLYVVSGGYEVYVGIGAFVGTGGPVGFGFGVIGNVGVRIWGEILGGLVSASAWGDLQFIVGIPPAFEGSIGLEACVLWVFCGSVDVHCGYNASDGFYLY
jgi:hypothetical protein